MKSNHLFIIVIITAALFSCKKDSDNLPPVTTPPSDIQPILLKDIVVPGLPSPYYHFEYDDLGYTTKAGFSADIRVYDISYVSRRINEMQSTHIINKDRLLYQYENGKVSLVKYIDKAGVNYKRCFITYKFSGQLEKMEWEIKSGSIGYALERTVSFTYYADGNLLELKDNRHAIDGQQNEAIYIDKFENYDNKVNTDGFMLLHHNNDHLILLPGIKLQNNNPLKSTRTGDGINYEINYIYAYNELKRPVNKKGDVVIKNGSNAGQHFQTNALFTYY